MEEITIWHNPKCSKSRKTLSLIEEHAHNPRIVNYLNDPPSIDEIKRVLTMLGCEPRGLMRTNEDLYKELGLADETDEATLIRAMVANPSLIERPVVIRGNRAALGRPPESVLSLLE